MTRKCIYWSNVDWEQAATTYSFAHVWSTSMLMLLHPRHPVFYSTYFPGAKSSAMQQLSIKSNSFTQLVPGCYMNFNYMYI